jgi:dTDP-alpha-D-glucuronic acid decarboxylase
MTTERVVVTGGSGFIGSHLVERLLSEGHHVTVFDKAGSRHLETASKHKEFELVTGDVRDEAALAKAIPRGTSKVFHLSAIVGIKHYVNDPLAVLDVNVMGTRNALAAAHKAGAKVVFTSTSEVYGKNPKIPWSEEDDRVLGPTTKERWSYSTSKAVGEHLALAMHKGVGLPVSIVRYFNVYGPRQVPDLVVSQSVRRVLRGEKPLLYDSGRQTRCFTFVDDAIEGTIRAAFRPEGDGQVFNIGRSVENTIRELLETILREADSKLGWEEVQTQQKFGKGYEDIERRVPDVSKAKRVLGWEAKTDLATGIRKTIEWARANPWYLE